VVSTLAGQAGAAADAVDGAGGQARFNNPFGIAVDGSGNLYIADANNNTVRKGTM
jgi:DNA-binding beta-propeller fold protein YncE